MTDNPLKSKTKAGPKLTPAEICEEGNARLRGELAYRDGEFYPRDDIEWRLVDGRPVLGWKGRPSGPRDLMDRRGQPMSESDTFALNKKLEKLGAKARYRADGSRYLVEA